MPSDLRLKNLGGIGIPEQEAVLRTMRDPGSQTDLLIKNIFSRLEQQRRGLELQATRISMEDKYRTANLGLREERLGMRRQQIAAGTEQASKAARIAGTWGLGISGLTAGTNILRGREERKMSQKLIDTITGFLERQA